MLFWRRKGKETKESERQALAFWRIIVGTALVSTVVLAKGDMSLSVVSNLTSSEVLWILVLGLVSVALGISAYFAGLERVSLTTASAMEACVAPLGAFISVVALPDEHLAVSQWAGGAITVLAALVPVVYAWRRESFLNKEGQEPPSALEQS